MLAIDRELPRLDESFSAILEIGRTDLGLAIAHIATIEQGTELDDYDQALQEHRQRANDLLNLAESGVEHLAVVRRGQISAVKFERPFIEPDRTVDTNSRLVVAGRVVELGLLGYRTERLTGLRVSALGFLGTATEVKDVHKALEELKAGCKEPKLFAGDRAIRMLGNRANIELNRIVSGAFPRAN